MPIVSVLVPVFNVSEYLEQCLDCLKAQTLTDIEIICIDDGSTDGSTEILKKYAEQDSRFRVISKRNTGYGDSLNKGLDVAEGEYVGIAEPDDFVEPGMLERMCAVATRDGLDIVRCGFWYRIGDADCEADLTYVATDVVMRPSEHKEVFYQPPSVWANLYRRRFLDENGVRFLPTPGASYQDTSFTFKAYSLAVRFEMIPDRFVHYRIDHNSSSFQRDSKIFCICDEYDEIWRFIGEDVVAGRLVLLLQYNGYKWNTKGLSPENSRLFQERGVGDLNSRANEIIKRSHGQNRMKAIMMKAVILFTWDMDHRRIMSSLYHSRIARLLFERFFGE